MTDFAGYVQLMRDETDSSSGQAAGLAAAACMLMIESLIAQREAREAVDLASKEPILRFIELKEVT